MALTVKPVVVLSRGFAVTANAEGGLDIRTGADGDGLGVPAFLDSLKADLGEGVALLDALQVSSASDLDGLFADAAGIDVVLACFLGVAPIDRLLRWPGPDGAPSPERSVATSASWAR